RLCPGPAFLQLAGPSHWFARERAMGSACRNPLVDKGLEAQMQVRLQRILVADAAARLERLDNGQVLAVGAFGKILARLAQFHDADNYRLHDAIDVAHRRIVED